MQYLPGNKANSNSIRYSSSNGMYGHIIEAKIYSRTDIFSDCRLQRSNHSNNCARSSEQQDMLALGKFSIPENNVVQGDRKSHPKIRYKSNT